MTNHIIICTSYIIHIRLLTRGTTMAASWRQGVLQLILWWWWCIMVVNGHPLALVLSRHSSRALRYTAPTKKISALRHGFREQSCKYISSFFPRERCCFTTALFSSVSESERIDDEVLEEADTVTTYQPGIPKGFFIVDHTSTPSDGFDMDAVAQILGSNEIDRLKLTSTNVTLPVALMLLDPETYPSLSRARKSCRKGYVLIHRGPLPNQDVFEPTKCVRGRVGDRVFAGDVLAQQVKIGNGWYNAQYHEKPPFDLPVVHEDDHFAIVNKPAGIVTYAHRNAGHGRMSVRAALPFCIKAPKAGTFSIISRPIACHRLDKPTSGLLIVAKTKPAMVNLTRQFAERKVKKTYTAIVNGIPSEDTETRITSLDAYKLGVDVDPNDENSWQVIDQTLDEKHAITVWRSVRHVKSLKARDGVLTMVELKPKTGRYHQLRRHMAWDRDSPLVGDKTYDDGTPESMVFRERGLFLCSNHVTLEHPYYNTVLGRKEWDNMKGGIKYGGGIVSQDDDGIVRVTASIELPSKFESFLSHEEARALKFDEKEQVSNAAVQ